MLKSFFRLNQDTKTFSEKCECGPTLEYQINVGLRLLNFELFSQAYALIRYPTFIDFPMHADTRLRTLCIIVNVRLFLLPEKN